MRNTSRRLWAIGSVALALALVGVAQAADEFDTRPTPGVVPALPTEAVGVNMHPERYPDPDAEMHFKMARELGITQARLAPEWSAIQPTPDTWNWEVTDRVVRMARQYDVKLLLVLCYNTTWNASVGTDTKSMPRDLQAWGTFCRKMAERYKGDILWWEVWNEQNSTGWLLGPYTDTAAGKDYHDQRWSDYGKLLKIAYENLKAVNPENVVVLGGITHDSDDWWKDLEAYYRVGAVQYCDVVGLHPYPGWADPLDTAWYPRYTDEMLAVMARHGDKDKPVWITETGYLVSDQGIPYVTEAQRAQWLADLFLVPLSRPQVQKVFFYALVDDVQPMGLCAADWSLHPTGERMKQLMGR